MARPEKLSKEERMLKNNLRWLRTQGYFSTDEIGGLMPSVGRDIVNAYLAPNVNYVPSRKVLFELARSLNVSLDILTNEEFPAYCSAANNGNLPSIKPFPFIVNRTEVRGKSRRIRTDRGFSYMLRLIEAVDEKESQILLDAPRPYEQSLRASSLEDVCMLYAVDDVSELVRRRSVALYAGFHLLGVSPHLGW